MMSCKDPCNTGMTPPEITENGISGEENVMPRLQLSYYYLCMISADGSAEIFPALNTEDDEKGMMEKINGKEE